MAASTSDCAPGTTSGLQYSGAPRLIAGLSQLAADYDVLLCDVWGVLHDGVSAHPEAGAALQKIRERRVGVTLVSNAPRTHSSVIAMLDEMGVARASYDAVVTSGDVTRAVLEEHKGARVFHLGPQRDIGTFEDLDIVKTGLDEAELVVCTDLVDEEIETADDYLEMLQTMTERKLTLICANPDIVVERGDRLVHCAGAIARLYEQMGGPTIYCGKPHRPIYDRALKIAEDLHGGRVDRRRVLCIGDALHTDMAGAAGAGFDSLFIASGIHAAELKAEHGAILEEVALAKLFSGTPQPRGVLPRLVW